MTSVSFFKQALINDLYQKEFNSKISDLFSGSTSLVNGKYTKLFESSFAQYIGCTHFSFLSNGLDALVLALKAAGISSGDEVIVPNHTYIATWLAPLLLGCKLKVAPVRNDNFLLDLDQISQYITSYTKAVMPVHLYGNTCDVEKLIALRDHNNFDFLIIEDAAQAHGSKLKNKSVGNLGDLTCFSFYPTKNLGALGEGGGISTNSSNFHDKIVSLRNYGRSLTNPSSNINCGVNNRGDELQALFLSIKLNSLNLIAANRRSHIKDYDKILENFGNIRLISYDIDSSPHLAIVQCESKQIRDRLKAYLSDVGVQTAIHYEKPCHDQAFLKSDKYSIEIDQRSQLQAKFISDTILSLPMSEVHTKDEINYVGQKISQFFNDVT